MVYAAIVTVPWRIKHCTVINLIITLPERGSTITMHSLGCIIEYSLLKKLVQISVCRVLHDNG